MSSESTASKKSSTRPDRRQLLQDQGSVEVALIHHGLRSRFFDKIGRSRDNPLRAGSVSEGTVKVPSFLPFRRGALGVLCLSVLACNQTGHGAAAGSTAATARAAHRAAREPAVAEAPVARPELREQWAARAAQARSAARRAPRIGAAAPAVSEAPAAPAARRGAGGTQRPRQRARDVGLQRLAGPGLQQRMEIQPRATSPTRRRPHSTTPPGAALTLPHDWSIELAFNSASAAGSGGGFLDGGVGWYRKSFTRRPGIQRPARSSSSSTAST